MRYYDVLISQSQASTVPVSLPTAFGKSVTRWQSYPNGVFDPEALDVEFDLYVAPYATPIGNSIVRIWGVDLATLKTAVQFAGNPSAKNPTPPMYIRVSGGMLAGLPLNTPKQAGLLAAGIVWQSYGNWRGTEMTLDLMLNAGGASFTRKVNLILNWQKGQTLQTALQNCLAVGFPGVPVTFAISANLIASSSFQKHRAHSLEGLAQLVSSITQQMQGTGSLGVQIVAQKGGITVFDGSAPPATRAVAFADLIGQPTWQGPYMLWLQTVLRGDIFVGDIIQLPPELSSLGPYVLNPNPGESRPAYRNQSVIQGKFLVIQARHVGRFRATDGAQWSSTYICIPWTNPTSSGNRPAGSLTQ